MSQSSTVLVSGENTMVGISKPSYGLRSDGTPLPRNMQHHNKTYPAPNMADLPKKQTGRPKYLSVDSEQLLIPNRNLSSLRHRPRPTPLGRGRSKHTTFNTNDNIVTDNTATSHQGSNGTTFDLARQSWPIHRALLSDQDGAPGCRA